MSKSSELDLKKMMMKHMTFLYYCEISLTLTCVAGSTSHSGHNPLKIKCYQWTHGTDMEINQNIRLGHL